MEFIPLIYYSLGIAIITALHTEFHKRHWPKCRACRSHSYLLSIIIGIITFAVGFISLSFIIAYINKIPHPYFWIIFAFTLIGTFPLFPMYSIGQKPILISSKSLWFFSSFIGLIASTNIILNRVFRFNPILFEHISHPIIIGSILTSFMIFSGYLWNRFLSPRKVLQSEGEHSILGLSHENLINQSPISGSDVILEKLLNHGELYILISWLLIFGGFVFLIIVPLLTKGAFF